MLRLLIDENVDHRILRGLKSRLPQIDYVVVKQIGLSGFPDLELLRWAAQENRIIVTHDKKTMIPDAENCLRMASLGSALRVAIPDPRVVLPIALM
jgi:hypothetical protein